MNNFPKPQDQQLDDQVSEFTDRVLSSNGNEAKMQEVLNRENELATLQETILRLKKAAQTARTNDATKTRIRASLLQEWNKNQKAQRQAPSRFTWNWSLPQIALASGFAILIIFGAITLLTSPTTALVGTADGSLGWSPLFILVGVVIIVFLLWRDRN